MPPRRTIVAALLITVDRTAADSVAVFAPWDGPGDSTPGMDQLPCWRIPALVHLTDHTTTGVPNDTLLMFAEGRWYNGDGCNPPGGASGPPTGPISAACQAKLDAVCNDRKANAPCIDATVKAWGNSSLPFVGLYDSAVHAGKAWRCYSVLGLDRTRKHWNGSFPGYCSEDGPRLASAYASSQCAGHNHPSPPAHPQSPPGAKRAVFSRKSTDCASLAANQPQALLCSNISSLHSRYELGAGAAGRRCPDARRGAH
jgi:hypothetical protein